MSCFSLSVIFVLIIGVLLIAGCTPPKDDNIESIDGIEPIGLLPEKVIEGNIFGKKLAGPYGLAADISGNLYVVDAGNDRLIKFDRDFNPIKETGGHGGFEGLLNSPTFIALDNSLNLFVSDAGNRRVSIFDSKLNYVDKVDLTDTEDPSKFGRPSGLRVNEYGELWVADPDKSRIWLFNSIGTFDRAIGGIESSGGFLSSPAGMATDTGRRIFVCDKGNGIIRVYDNFGIHIFDFGAENMSQPSGMAIDHKKNIWVVDSHLPGLFCFDGRGELLFSAGESGHEGNFSMNKPIDVTVTPDNLLVVSDGGNDRLLIYRILYPET